MADIEQAVDQGSSNVSRDGSQQQNLTHSPDQLSSSSNGAVNAVLQQDPPSHDLTAMPTSSLEGASEANYTTSSAPSTPSLIQRGSRMSGSKPSSRQGSKSDVLSAEPNHSRQNPLTEEQTASPKRSHLSVDNISSPSSLTASQQPQQQKSPKRSSRRASAADIPIGSTRSSQIHLSPEPQGRRSLLGSLTKTGSAQSLAVGGDMRVLENMYNEDSALNEAHVLMRSPSGSRPRLMGGKSKSVQSLLQGAKEAFEKATGTSETKLQRTEGQENQVPQEQEAARHMPSTSVPSVLVSQGDVFDYGTSGFDETKGEPVGSETSLLERARQVPLPLSRAGSLAVLAINDGTPFLTLDRAPSIPTLPQNKPSAEGGALGQAAHVSSLLDTAVRSPLPVSRSPSFSAPFSSDLEDGINAVIVNTSRLLNGPLVADAQAMVAVEPEPTPIVHPVNRPVLTPLQVSQHVSSLQGDLSYINHLTHEQLVQLAKVQHQQIQTLHSIREEEVDHLSRSLLQSRAENSSLRNKILQLSQQPGSRALSKQSSFADLPSTLQQALSCDSVDDAINLIKNDPLGAAVPVAESQPPQLANVHLQSRHGSKQELSKKYGSGMISNRGARKGERREGNDSTVDIEKIRLKEDLIATNMENERLLEYLHLLISRIMEVPEAIRVLASPVTPEKPVVNKF